MNDCPYREVDTTNYNTKLMKYCIYCIYEKDYYRFNEDILPIARIIKYKQFLILFILAKGNDYKRYYQIITNTFNIDVLYYKKYILDSYELYNYNVYNYEKRYLDIIDSYLTKK